MHRIKSFNTIKIYKAESASAKKKKKKWENIMQDYRGKKSERSENLCTSIKRSTVYLYQEKWL